MGQDAVKIETIGMAHESGGQGEVEDDEMAAGLEDAAHPGEGRWIVGHVAQPEGDGDDIKLASSEGQRQSVGHQGLAHAAAGGMRQHFRTEVRRDDLAGRQRALDFQGQITGAAGDIQQAGGLPLADARGDDVPPPQVRPATQHVIG